MSSVASRSQGLTVIELLVACAIGGIALAAAWPWLFTTTAASGREERRLEADTSLAFVTRLTADELRRASAFVATPAPGCSARSVAFVVPRADGTGETIVYAWNSATRVLWRKTSGSHLASGVTAFAVDYFAATGDALEPAGASLDPNQLARVRRVRLTVSLTCGTDVIEASWDVTLRVSR